MRLLLLVAVWAGCKAPESAAPAPPPVRSWAIQLQGYDRPGALDALAAFPCDLLVIDPVRTVRGQEAFPVRPLVATLRRDKTVLAYVNVGQAENYRTYWTERWRAPEAGRRGAPDFVLATDPDGWPGNYPVAYWDPAWRDIVRRLVMQAAADGFDGVFLDWVLGFEHGPVVAAATADGMDPARAMSDLVRDVRAWGRSTNPGFLVVPLNAAGLAGLVPGFVDHVDGVCQEPFLFTGAADVAWDAPEAGDVRVPAETTARWTKQLGFFAGKFVLTLDYALEPDHVAAARARSRSLGFVPFVTRTPLDRLPDSPGSND